MSKLTSSVSAPIVSNVTSPSPSTDDDSRPTWSQVKDVVDQAKTMKVESEEKDRRLAQLERELKQKDQERARDDSR
jgi:hypothetical protein